MLVDETGGWSLLYREDSPHWGVEAEVIAPVFSAFAAVMKEDPVKEALLQLSLSEALNGVDAHIAECGESYLLWDKTSARDINLASLLQHVAVAGGHFRKVGIRPYTKLQRFYDSNSVRPEWSGTEFSSDALLDECVVHT